MANLITHGLTFTKESLTEYFLKPLFVDSDIRDIVQLRTDLKTGEKLDLISTLSHITKGYAQGLSFTPSTGVTITQKTVTVVTMKAEVKQNGRAFLNYVKQQALKSGYAENDITGTIFEEIVLTVFMRALMADLNRQAFFGDVTKEVIVSDAPNGTLDADYKEYDGLWTRIIAQITAGTIAASQYLDINTSTYQDQVAVKHKRTITLSGTSGTCTITINGRAYTATFATSTTVTATNFVTANQAAIALLFGQVSVTSSTNTIIVESGVPGLAITATISAAVTGDLTGTVANTTANVENTTLKAGAGKAILKGMYDRMTPELRANLGLANYTVTGSVMDAYITDLESDGTEAAHVKLVDGVRSIAYRGIPVKERRDWDVHIAAGFSNVRPHRAILTIAENLIVGTDADSDITNAEMWYNVDTQENGFRVEYKAGTQILEEKFITAAY